MPKSSSRAALCVLLATALSSGAHAMTFNVADGDVRGLISAIVSANTTQAEDTITLAENGLYTLTAVNNNGYWGPTGLPATTRDLTTRGNSTASWMR